MVDVANSPFPQAKPKSPMLCSMRGRYVPSGGAAGGAFVPEPVNVQPLRPRARSTPSKKENLTAETQRRGESHRRSVLALNINGHIPGLSIPSTLLLCASAVKVLSFSQLSAMPAENPDTCS